MELGAGISWWSLTQGTSVYCLPSGNISENKLFMPGRCLHQGRGEQQRNVFAAAGQCRFSLALVMERAAGEALGTLKPLVHV